MPGGVLGGSQEYSGMYGVRFTGVPGGVVRECLVDDRAGVVGE